MFAINYAQGVQSHFVEGRWFVADALKGEKWEIWGLTTHGHI